MTRAVPEGSVIDLSDAQVPNIVLPIPPPPATVPHAPKNVTDRNDVQFKKVDVHAVAEEVTVGKTTVSKFVHPEKVLAKVVIEF